MNYISTSKLKFIIETLARNAIFELNSAQLQGLFKKEYFYLGQTDVLQKISDDLKLNLDIDKLKI